MKSSFQNQCVDRSPIEFLFEKKNMGEKKPRSKNEIIKGYESRINKCHKKLSSLRHTRDTNMDRVRKNDETIKCLQNTIDKIIQRKNNLSLKRNKSDTKTSGVLCEI